jgi:hypothetical protein
MTDLQASLIGIGGAILVGVVSYNKWQEFKAKRSVERAFSSDHDDVLMNEGANSAGQRREPVLVGDLEAETADPAMMREEMAQDQPFESTANTFAAPAQQPAQRELPIDELIDCVIPMSLPFPMRGEKILPLVQTVRHVGNKPVNFVGQREDGNWDVISRGSVYTALTAGVQLANRSTALNEIEYSELVARLRQVADELDAEPDVPDMSSVISIARELQQFVNEYDAKLSVNVISKGAPWAVNTLLAALERQGFDLRPDGRLVMPDGDGGILFSLSTNVTLAAETTSKLTLLLDVPCVAPARDGFGAMIACARMLASRLDGIVVDDANQPLTEEALAQIAEQVATFYGHMEEANVPAGSIRALRLFG